VLTAIYLVAGIFHLCTPDTFLLITPDWVPFQRQVILGTGLCEIAGAVALLTHSRVRGAAGMALALYAVCVFPANVKHFIDGVATGGVTLGWWYHIPRLAFQPVFVWWALFAGEVVSGPFRKMLGR
jgi:uncharacterized membrane protein